MYNTIGVSAPFNVQLNTTLYIFNLAVRSKEGKPSPVIDSFFYLTFTFTRFTSDVCLDATTSTF